MEYFAYMLYNILYLLDLIYKAFSLFCDDN